MSIATEISRLQGAKADIKTAIEGKGVSVPSSALLDSYPDYIDAIQQGGGGEEHTYTGHVDTAGLTALGWDADDIAWLQDHVWWNAEDDDFWAVTEANLAFGPNGATPLTWANRASIKTNSDVRYFPKFDPSPSSPTSWASLFFNYNYVCAIPTHGWDTQYVTSLSQAFKNCTILRSIGDLSQWDTSNVTTMFYLFYNCYCLLATGDLSTWDTSKVTNMGYMFANCCILYSIGDITSWNVGNVTTIQNMFNTCYCLLKIGDLSNWNTSKVTTFGSVFGNCYHITDIGDLSDWDVSKATSLGGFFSGCYSLRSVGDLSDWEVGNVTDCSYMFNNCVLLEQIGDLSDWDTSKVTTMVQMFGNCRHLSTVGDIKNWNVGALKNATGIFNACSMFTELNLYGWTLTACTNVGYSSATSPFAVLYQLGFLKLGPHFFDGTPTTHYFQDLRSWTRDSLYESLYTNQTLRNSQSTAITVKLYASVYDSLSAQDISDIATKNITLTRG